MVGAAIVGALAVIVGAVITGVVTWSVARRTKSGKIDTSEAATLWDEGTKMRGELRDELVSTKEQLGKAITAITALNEEIRRSRAETEASREETRLSRAETRKLMLQIDNVHDEIKTANALTIGALADNTETRRILEIPKEERTEAENQHVATAGDRIDERHLPDIPPADQEMPPGQALDDYEEQPT